MLGFGWYVWQELRPPQATAVLATEQGAALWDMVWEAGEPHGIVPAGIGVYGTTGRIEKGYRAFGFELDGEYDVVEADMAWGKVKEQDFIGKEAHVRQREREPAAVMCTLTVDDHTSASGMKRYMLGHEPIVTRDGVEREIDVPITTISVGAGREAEVRRTVPLSLRLVRLGGEEIIPALVRALRAALGQAAPARVRS